MNTYNLWCHLTRVRLRLIGRFMESQPSRAQRVAFGPFEYDGGSGELRKFGNRIRLQGQPLRILSILLEQPGRVVGRDELQRELWQGTTFVDFEQGLNAAVNKMRAALGDSAEQPRYVETVPGRGYRFIAPVQVPGAKPVLEMASPTPIRTETAPRKPARQWFPWAAGAALVIVGVGSYWLGTLRAGAGTAQARPSVAPPPGFALQAAASRQSFALSPDGAHLAFAAMDTSGAFRVFLQDLDSMKLRALPDSEGAHTIFWAPDGRSLFLTVRGKVRRSPLEGEANLLLCDSPSFMLSGAWLRPDKLLLSGRAATYTVSPSGGMPKAADNAYRWPQALDGQILYTVWDSHAGRYRGRVAPFDQPGSAKDLMESDSRVQYTASDFSPGTGFLLYVRAGNLVAQPFDTRLLQVVGDAVPIVNKAYSYFPTGAADFSVSQKGVISYQKYEARSQLAWVDRTGRQVAVTGPAKVNLESARLSPDGRWLATAMYDVERGGQDLWILDVQTGAARRLGISSGVSDAPVWSPDSKRLAFLHAFNGEPPRIAIRGIGAGDAEETFPPGGYQAPADWSSDGRFVAFVNTGFPRFANETQGDVWLVDLARDRKLVPLLNTPFHEANPAFSPDGKWLAFTSDESGQPEVYLQAFRSGDPPAVVGERYLVSRAGAQALRWRRDGRELFYLGFDGRVHAIPVRLSPKPEFGPAAPLFTISTEARAAVHSILGFDVSVDGQRFLIPVVDSSQGSSIVVVPNWEAELLRR